MKMENEQIKNINESENIEKEAILKELAEKEFSVWNNALQSKNPKEVASLYDENASFLPTFSPDFKKNKAGAEEYFKHFLEKDPKGEVIDSMVQETSRNEKGEITGFLYSGFYNFEVGEPDNRQISEARFTFLWSKDKEGNWKIIHHHSSAKPQK